MYAPRKVFLIIICLVITFYFINYGTVFASAPGETWVNYNYDSETDGWGITRFSDIQSAVDAVKIGGTVTVYPGTYQEQVNINKSLTLQAEDPENRPVIDGGGSERVLSLNADNITVDSFEIANGSQNVVWIESNDNTIRNCLIRDAEWRLIIWGTSGNTIEGCTLRGDGEGIGLYNGATNNIIKNNDIKDGGCTGIRLNLSSNNHIIGNTLENFRGHITLLSSDDNVIANNTIHTSWGYLYHSGMIIYQSSNNTVIKNHISDISGSGIRIFNSSSNNNLRGNTIQEVERAGIELYYQSNDNQIINNSFSEGSYGIILDQTSSNDISKNIFFNNQQNAWDNGENSWTVGGKGNYWDDHESSGNNPYLITRSGIDTAPLSEKPQISPVAVPPLIPGPETPAESTIQINSAEVWQDDDNFDLQNRVLIKNGGKLTIRNVNMNVETVNYNFIEVQDGGRLVIENSVITGKGQDIMVEDGGELKVEDSELYNLGHWDGGGALHIDTENTEIRNNIIKGSYVGINLRNPNGHEITGNTIIGGSEAIMLGRVVESLVGETGGNLIQNNIIENQILHGINLTGVLDSTISGNTFRNIWGYSLFLRGAVHENSAGNHVFENTFIEPAVYDYNNDDVNSWYDQKRGNYWSDYLEKYPQAKENSSHPGTWDIPYDIPNDHDINPQDFYPLMKTDILYYKTFELTANNRAEFIFNNNIKNNHADIEALKTGILFAADAENYGPLKPEDDISFDNNRMIITFAEDLAGSMNRIVIPKGALQDDKGNAYNREIKAGELTFKQTNRLAGKNRYATAVEISKDGWDSASTVVLTRGDDYADALAGVPLAYNLNAPILLTTTANLDNITEAEIERLGASKIILLGGEAAISDDVKKALEVKGLEVERIWGDNRYETAAKIAERLSGEGVSFDAAFIAVGTNFADALAASSYAAMRGEPVLLVGKKKLPSATQDAIDKLGITSTYVCGGEAAISNTVFSQLPTPERFWGDNRYETALALSEEFLPDGAYHVGIATGLDYPDAVAGGVWAAKNNTGIILVNGKNEEPHMIVQSFISNNKITKVTIFGGEKAINNSLGSWFKNNLE